MSYEFQIGDGARARKGPGYYAVEAFEDGSWKEVSRVFGRGRDVFTYEGILFRALKRIEELQGDAAQGQLEEVR